jgi:alkyldihydroxyacetonephosphate synthase
VLDLGAMRHVLAIERENRRALVEPGVLLGRLDWQARSSGLMVGHDPWSQALASVGGATSTNGVGYLAGKYGSMGEQVLGVEAVLASGEVVRTPGIPKASVGPSLQDLFIGGEGVFGVITQVDLRLFPLPERREHLGFRFSCFEAGLDAVLEMAAIGLRPAMIDFEEDDPPPGDLQVGRLVDLSSPMYLAFDGFEAEVAAQLARAQHICLRSGGEELDRAETLYFWDHRHDSADRWLAERREDPRGLAQRDRVRRWSSAYLNVTLPASAIQVFRTRAAKGLAPYRLAVKSSGLWGMPELYSVKLEHQQPDDPAAPEELDAGTDYGLRLAQELGGSMEYCHGVGLRLGHLMEAELGGGMTALQALKRALDPEGLLNPGKLGL